MIALKNGLALFDTSDIIGRLESEERLGSIYFIERLFDEAIFHFQNALDLALGAGNPHSAKRVQAKLSEAFVNASSRGLATAVSDRNVKKYTFRDPSPVQEEDEEPDHIASRYA